MLVLIVSGVGGRGFGWVGSLAAASVRTRRSASRAWRCLFGEPVCHDTTEACCCSICLRSFSIRCRGETITSSMERYLSSRRWGEVCIEFAALVDAERSSIHFSTDEVLRCRLSGIVSAFSPSSCRVLSPYTLTNELSLSTLRRGLFNPSASGSLGIPASLTLTLLGIYKLLRASVPSLCSDKNDGIRIMDLTLLVVKA